MHVCLSKKHCSITGHSCTSALLFLSGYPGYQGELISHSCIIYNGNVYLYEITKVYNNTKRLGCFFCINLSILYRYLKKYCRIFQLIYWLSKLLSIFLICFSFLEVWYINLHISNSFKNIRIFFFLCLICGFF